MANDRYSDEEKDIEMLVFSLIGILTGKTDEGLAAKERARKISGDTNNFFERRGWL